MATSASALTHQAATIRINNGVPNSGTTQKSWSGDWRIPNADNTPYECLSSYLDGG